MIPPPPSPRPEPPRKRPQRQRPDYRLVEVPPQEQDPRAAEAVLDWLAARLG